MMRFMSVCSGIEAASVAWDGLMNPVLYSEIEAFPRAVLCSRQRAADARRYVASHAVPLWGDFTTIRVRDLVRRGFQLPDVLIGGTPCQSFSVAGARRGRLRQMVRDTRSSATRWLCRLSGGLERG